LAADFTASLLGGGAFTLSEQRGHPVLVLFTASWCGDCIPEINKMAQLQQELGGRGLRQLVLSVDPSDTQAQFADFRQRTHGGNLQWALDPGQLATRAYRVRATDTKVLIGPQEQVAWRTMGPTGLEALRQRIVALIA
jgi:peroxiredoxin